MCDTVIDWSIKQRNDSASLDCSRRHDKGGEITLVDSQPKPKAHNSAQLTTGECFVNTK